MSKTIKVDDEVYQDLDQYRGKGETFSDAIKKLLYAARAIHIGAEVLEVRPPVMRSSILSEKSKELIERITLKGKGSGDPG